MRRCEINNIIVECSDVMVDSHSFGKALSPQHAESFHLEVDFADASLCFSDYYRNFIEREAEDEGFEENLDGDYLQLRETGYLSFEQMLMQQPELLSRVLLKLLPTEFMGYLFTYERERKPKYVLQTLHSVRIAEGRIICSGESFSILTR
jgi:hypothetical protein